MKQKRRSETDPKIAARYGFYLNDSGSGYGQGGRKEKVRRKAALPEIMDESDVNGSED